MNRAMKEAFFNGLFWVLYCILVSLLLIKFIAYLNG
jgi:hypothetical protein